MSNQPPPPPGFHRPTYYTQPAGYGYGSAYPSTNGPHSETVTTVPPPLYGYNPNAVYGSYQPQHQPAWHRQGFTNTNAMAMSPIGNAWKCQECQTSLESEEALRAHRESHIQCNKCNFSASPKVVKVHFESKHGKFAGRGFKSVTIAIPGCRVQRFRICVGDHPDDIQQWIQDRKRRFPRQHKPATETKDRDASNEDQTNERSDSKQAAAFGSLLEGYGSSSSDSDADAVEASAGSINSDADESVRTALASTAQKHSNGLSEAGYDAAKILEPSAARTSNYGTRPCRYFMRNGTCRNGDACNFSHEVPKPTATPKARRSKHSSSTTLLRKLLKSDVQREATLTLQLLHHVVDNNFLQTQNDAKRRTPKQN